MPAYTETYNIHFTNEQSQDVIVAIFKKGGPTVTIANYMAVSLELSDKSEGQTKYDSTIICRELVLSIWSEEGDDITWETFITAEHDEWFINVKVDGQLYFEGFITPDEGNSPFQDKPYEITIRATNGLSLLKDIPLVDINGNKFNGNNKLTDYIAGALKQTGLLLHTKYRCSYINSSMSNRDAGLQYDMFSQTYLNYRAFQKDALNFVSCYDALKLILDKFCRLEYWFGYWQIKCIGDLQYLPGDDYWTEYNSSGVFVAAHQETENYGQIGKAVDIYPINEDQQIYSRFAIKSAKTIFNYTPWPEIPKNNKFERGAVIPGIGGQDPATQNTSVATAIDDWEQGLADVFSLPHPSLSAVSNRFYRLSTYNIYGIEIDRSVACETLDVDTNHQFWLRSEGLPFGAGDKLRIGIQYRTESDFSSSSSSSFSLPVGIYLVGVDGNAYNLDSSNNNGGSNIGIWKLAVNVGTRLEVGYAPSQDTTQWNSLSVESLPVPIDGTLYIVYNGDGPVSNTGAHKYWKDFTFEYLPFVNSGYVTVKGDYWLRSQNKVFPDVAEDAVGLSDSPKRMLQGAMLKSDGLLTQPTWYRYNKVGDANPVFEQRHFKELLNIARFNHSYRRMYALDGSFNGLNYAAQNDQLNKFPIGFHKRYRLVDMDNPRDFVLAPPLSMDLIKGWIKASLVEVVNPADAIEVGPTPMNVVSELMGRINSTTEAQWNSASGAPPHGTPYFPPVARLYTNVPNAFTVFMDAGNNATASASDNGVGNSPSITEIYNYTALGLRWIIYQVGTDVQIDNVFTISIYGHNIIFEVVSKLVTSDGTQVGDSSSFNYVF